MGGVLSSDLFHDDEKGVPDSAFVEFNYGEQSEDEYKQLDTENDQKGDTAVEHIFKKTKTVYGQPAKDMKGMMIDWAKEYNIVLTKRPCPYDFPAFEADKPPDYDEKKKEAEKLEKQTETEKKSGAVVAEQKLDTSKASKLRKKRSRSKSRSSGNKKGPKGKKSADAEFDECSLEA
uniref:Uncharacterized protein n=1 Tax=Parascaris univalens TaxID=6257 RepID=A0A915AM13_PARUN